MFHGLTYSSTSVAGQCRHVWSCLFVRVQSVSLLMKICAMTISGLVHPRILFLESCFEAITKYSPPPGILFYKTFFFIVILFHFLVVLFSAMDVCPGCITIRMSKLHSSAPGKLLINCSQFLPYCVYHIILHSTVHVTLHYILDTEIVYLIQKLCKTVYRSK